MTKLLNELNENELKKVWDNNKKLREKIEEYYIESEMYHITDLLNPIKEALIDWGVGFYNRNYITINTNKTGLLYQGMSKSQESYCLFSDETWDIVKSCFEDEDYKRIENILVDTFDDWTQAPDNDMVHSYFIEYYVDLLDDSYYVDSDYILYQTFTKSYQ